MSPFPQQLITLYLFKFGQLKKKQNLSAIPAKYRLISLVLWHRLNNNQYTSFLVEMFERERKRKKKRKENKVNTVTSNLEHAKSLKVTCIIL